MQFGSLFSCYFIVFELDFLHILLTHFVVAHFVCSIVLFNFLFVCFASVFSINMYNMLKNMILSDLQFARVTKVD